MPRRAVFLLAALLAVSAPTRAQKPAPAAPVQPAGLVKMLSDGLTGRAVMGAGVGYAGPKAAYDPADLKKAETLLDKCQVIAAAASKGDSAIIPFQVGKAYVLAPETREDVVTDFSGTTALETMSPFAIVADVLTGLTDAQLKQLGSEAGVGVADLSPAAQAELAYMFAPPLKMPDGTLQREALDWSQVRLRGRVGARNAVVPGPNGYEATFADDRGNSGGIAPTRRFAAPFGVGAPALREVPNTFRPSDLTGAAFPQPFGAGGVLRVEDAAARVAKVTGLRLRVARAYRDVPFFVGSSAVSCGEVLDGLRLALQGAWRRMGGTYILAWDVRGIGALEQIVAENARTPVILEAKAKSMDRDFSSRWLDILAALPPDPDDPLALTRDQKDALFNARDEGARLPFSKMTPAQQKYLVTRAGDEGFFLPPDGEGPRRRRPLTLEEIQTAYIKPDARVTLEMQLPGKGWLPVQSPPPWGWLLTPTDYLVRRSQIARPPERATPSPTPPPAEDALTVSSDIRAVMVPVLTPGILDDTAKTMKRHGFNTLVYPALADGYTTFPNPAFPLDPKLKGQDGWAMAESSAKAAGLRMVGYVSALASRGANDKAHWLEDHPEWIDRDIAGRTRLQWVAEHPAWPPGYIPGAVYAGLTDAFDFVRPSEPRVAAKLDALMEALMRRAPSGVLLVDWKPSASVDSSHAGADPPALGYAMPERLEAIRRTGDDLVDELGGP